MGCKIAYSIILQIQKGYVWVGFLHTCCKASFRHRIYDLGLRTGPDVDEQSLEHNVDIRLSISDSSPEKPSSQIPHLYN